jgi:16S rRNA (guanine(527)-N(7))-methyltransferase RsmG
VKRTPLAQARIRLLTRLPELSPEQFAERLAFVLPEIRPTARQLVALFAHFEELRRWAPRVDLIGPGTAEEVVERHFAESLAALPWLPEEPVPLLDLGSGAGFPGLVLAAARPDLEVTLVEPRERRRAFLATAARRAGLSVRISGARVALGALSELPGGVAVVTVRALRLDSAVWAALAERLRPEARLLFWSGKLPPELPPEFLAARERHLPGAQHRRLREYRLRGIR